MIIIITISMYYIIMIIIIVVIATGWLKKYPLVRRLQPAELSEGTIYLYNIFFNIVRKKSDINNSCIYICILCLFRMFSECYLFKNYVILFCVLLKSHNTAKICDVLTAFPLNRYIQYILHYYIMSHNL